MFHRIASLGALALGVVSVSCAGCFFGGPSRVYPPKISPSEAGSKAMEQYDTNKDGVVKGDELDKAPSLKAALKQLDTNHDGGVSADEVAARIRQWQDSKVGRMSLCCMVKLNGQPLSKAEVTFDPEKFLGTQIQPCHGTSDASGVVSLSIPVKGKEPPGAACGLYLVRISKKEGGRELIPARYNTQTTLGHEVALDAEGMQEGMICFDLKSP